MTAKERVLKQAAATRIEVVPAQFEAIVRPAVSATAGGA